MTKLGTPIGAGPTSAIVSVGLVSVGLPSALRGGFSSGSSLSSVGTVAAAAVVVAAAVAAAWGRRRRRRPRRAGDARAGTGSGDRFGSAPDRGRDGARGLGGGVAGLELSSGSEQPLSVRSVRPSPSSSLRFARSGSADRPQALAAGEIMSTPPLPLLAGHSRARGSDHDKCTCNGERDRYEEPV